jgi:hypothetical protein
MQGPSLDKPLLSFLKRKRGTSKVLSRKTKKKIDTKVVDASDMVRVLASAFKVLTFTLFPFPFVFFD